MTDASGPSSSSLAALADSQLTHQVKISYDRHHEFLLRQGLRSCRRVLDLGTGNGLFAARLAADHPAIEFIGIDKRASCIEACRSVTGANFQVMQADLFSSAQPVDLSAVDGYLLRYFLLHIDHATKIFERIRSQSKRPAKLWILDLDPSQMRCEPPSDAFDRLVELVREFCRKTSVETHGAEHAAQLLKTLGYRNVVSEAAPFTSENVATADLALYLKQEIECYARMRARGLQDPVAVSILRFIDEEVRTGRTRVSYGMSLISAELSNDAP